MKTIIVTFEVEADDYMMQETIDADIAEAIDDLGHGLMASYGFHSVSLIEWHYKPEKEQK